MSSGPIVFIGPGSEWFWSMAQFIAVVVTLLGIYRQLRAQAAANSLQQMQFLVDRWGAEKMTHARVTSAIHVKHDAPGAPMKPGMGDITDFFESVYLLADAGSLNRLDVHNVLGRSAQMWWAILGPSVEAESRAQGAPMYEGWQKLVEEERLMDAKAGYPFKLDADTLPAIIDDVIEYGTGQLRLLGELRSGVIPEPPQTHSLRTGRPKPDRSR